MLKTVHLLQGRAREQTEEAAHRPAMHAYQYGVVCPLVDFFQSQLLARIKLVGRFTAFHGKVQISRSPAREGTHKLVVNFRCRFYPFHNTPVNLVQFWNDFHGDIALGKGSHCLVGSFEVAYKDAPEGDMAVMVVKTCSLLQASIVEVGVYTGALHDAALVVIGLSVAYQVNGTRGCFVVFWGRNGALQNIQNILFGFLAVSFHFCTT